MDAAGKPMRLTVQSYEYPKWQPLRFFRLIGGNRMRPGSTKTQSFGRFFRRLLSGSFNDRPKWITYQVSVLTIGVVDAPKLVARFRYPIRVRAHDPSSAQSAFAKMYLIHKMHGQSW